MDKETSEKGKYDAWKKEHSMSSSKGVKEKYEDMCEVRDAYRKWYDWFDTSCEAEKGKDGSGGSWFTHREKQEKTWAMWFKPFDADNFKSNVKSPMTTGRIEAAMHLIKQMGISWKVLPTEEDDVEKAQIIQLVLNWLFSQSKYKYRLATWYKEALMFGTAYMRAYYLKTEREIQLAKKDPEKMSKEEKDMLKETMGRKTIFGEPEKILENDDLVIEPISYKEFYHDPDARFLHGSMYRAGFAGTRRLMSIEQFRMIYGNDPNCFDTDKVKAIGSYTNNEIETVFELPKDTEGDYVEVIEYENINEDKYKIVANDILIRKTPLPYNHKQCSFVKIGAIEHPHQFYWRGLTDQLMAIQSEEEILKNMQYDKLHQTLKDRFIVNKRDYNKFVEAYNKTRGMMMPASVEGRALDQVVQFIPNQPIDFSAFRVIEGIKQDATIASQFDPSQLAVASQAQTATQSMINKQVVDRFIYSTMESFSEGLVTLGEILLADIRQFWSIPKVKKITGKDKKEKIEKVFRKIRLEQHMVDIGKDGVKVFETTDPYTFFEVKDKYLDLKGDVDIILDTASMKIPNPALDAQQAKEAFAQLMIFAVNPDDPKSVRANPLPLFDARKIAEWYVKANDVPERILLKDNLKPEANIMEAFIQNVTLNKGESVPAQPGEPVEHVAVHQQQMEYWNSQLSNLQYVATQKMNQGMPIDEQTTMLGQQLDRVLQVYDEHLAGDQSITGENVRGSAPKPPLPTGSNVNAVMGGGEAGGPQPNMPQMGGNMPTMGATNVPASNEVVPNMVQ